MRWRPARKRKKLYYNKLHPAKFFLSAVFSPSLSDSIPQAFIRHQSPRNPKQERQQQQHQVERIVTNHTHHANNASTFVCAPSPCPFPSFPTRLPVCMCPPLLLPPPLSPPLGAISISRGAGIVKGKPQTRRPSSGDNWSIIEGGSRYKHVLVSHGLLPTDRQESGRI